MKFLLIPLIISIGCNLYGQKNMEVSPIIPEVIQQFNNVRDFTISSSGDEAYFTAQSLLGERSVIFNIQQKDGIWQEPNVISFSGIFHDLEPFISPDGLTLYFVSDRPLKDTSMVAKDYDIWYVSRNSIMSAWSAPINLGSPINTSGNEFYPSVSGNRNLYFTSDGVGTKGRDDIFVSYWSEDTYSTPVSLSDSINSDGYEFNAYVSPDESYLIFSGYNRDDGYGSGDLYISTKYNGLWQKAINLGNQVNSKQMDYCPFVISDTLYFTSKRSTMSKDKISSLNQFLSEVNSYENGMSRIYQVNFKEFYLINRK